MYNRDSLGLAEASVNPEWLVCKMQNAECKMQN
jgi:hypothetical protein